MYMKHVGIAAAFAVSFAAAQASAATLTIDTFTTSQVVSDVPGTGNVNMSTMLAPEAIGGTRTMTAKNSTSNRSTDATTFDSFGGILTFSNTRNATGSGTLAYNGGGAGLGNFAIGSNPFFRFEGASFDNDSNVNITVTLTDTSNTMISYMENVASGSFSPDLFFTQFAGNEAFDFTNVASLTFMADTTGLGDNIDGQIGAITLNAGDVAPVPLPASALLLLGGMGGLTALRRRRKA